MRPFPMAMWVVAAATTVGCARHEVAAAAIDGVLVLEVGGDQSSLRQALLTAGVDVAPPQPREPREPEAEPPPPSSEPHEAGAATPRAADQPTAVAAADHVVVELGRGETLMQLAKKHLGSSARYHEILERNGWSEADARRLRAGQLVKVPIDRAPTGR